jgi:hypothetical protein
MALRTQDRDLGNWPEALGQTPRQVDGAGKLTSE